MPQLSATAALDLWERGDALGPVERALVLAAAADADARAPDELAELPLGRRDARVLMLHSALAGSAMEATAACPACGEDAEFTVDAEALLVQPSGEPAAIELDGFVVDWRPPDSRDVAAAALAASAVDAERTLLARCISSARGPGGEVRGAELPPRVRDALARAIGEADPLAEVLVDVVCPSCEAVFVADVDVAGFVWARLRAHAQQLLADVDALARAYGWTESAVLALGDRRRAAYLEIAGTAGA
jgi:hypothetical protein